MKHKMITLILALTVVSWAQTATQPTPSTPPQSSAPAEKAKCPCCDKMAAADTKDAHASCADHMKHMKHAGDGKEMAGCCSGKDKDAKSCCAGDDAKSCMKGDKDKSACCGENAGKDKTAGACCGGKDCGKGCCSKKTEKAVSSCSRSGMHS
jgi:hypothetical protein